MKAEEYGKLLTIAQVKDLLEQELHDRKELSYDQKLTVSHIDRIRKLPLESSGEMVEHLLKIERVTEYLAYKIVEVIPRDKEAVDMVFQRERFRLTDEEKEQILEIVAKYA